MTTTFNAVTGRALTRALASLSASTTLTVTVMGIRYQGERLCSPFLTHQNVTVGPHRDSPYGVVLLDNERFHVYAAGPSAAFRWPEPPSGMVWHEASLPPAAIYAAIKRLAAIAPGLQHDVWDTLEGYQPHTKTALVRVAVAMPRLIGWDEAGRPLFAEQPEQPEPGTGELAGITEARFSPEDEPPAPADDDPEPEPEG